MLLQEQSNQGLHFLSHHLHRMDVLPNSNTKLAHYWTVLLVISIPFFWKFYSNCMGRQCWPVECSVIKPNFIGFEEKSSYWSVHFFSAFLRSTSIGKPRMTPVSSVETMETYEVCRLGHPKVVHLPERNEMGSLITALGQTLRAVHSSNNWLHCFRITTTFTNVSRAYCISISKYVTIIRWQLNVYGFYSHEIA